MSLQDKVSLITGAARGIGKAIAMKLATEGSNIAICDVDTQALEQTKSQLEETKRDVIAGKVDVTNFEQVQGFIQKILDKFGKIDILINNAGITRDSLIMRMSDADWDRVIDVNLKGAFNCIKAVAKPMVKQREGRVVNIASIIGVIGNPGQANYAASKGGLIALTKTCAKEFASRNINVNAIAPGFIKTDMTERLPEDWKTKLLNLIPLGQLGNVGDVANAVLFLVGENSAYITGQVVHVDGGMVM